MPAPSFPVPSFPPPSTRTHEFEDGRANGTFARILATWIVLGSLSWVAVGGAVWALFQLV